MRYQNNSFLFLIVIMLFALSAASVHAQEIPGCCETFLYCDEILCGHACFAVDDQAELDECNSWNESAPNMSSTYTPGYECINGDDFDLCSCVPITLVELSAFTAAPLNKAVKITWSTDAEVDNAGFNVYRSETQDGDYRKINEEIISAQGSPTGGADYQYVDEEVENRTIYFYKLEDQDTQGVSTMHGPVSATPRLIRGN